MRIFFSLVNYYHVDPDKITILSQYKAQCTEIENNLKGLGYEHPNVGTVIASQGRSTYPVFSAMNSTYMMMQTQIAHVRHINVSIYIHQTLETQYETNETSDKIRFEFATHRGHHSQGSPLPASPVYTPAEQHRTCMFVYAPWEWQSLEWRPVTKILYHSWWFEGKTEI